MNEDNQNQYDDEKADTEMRELLRGIPPLPEPSADTVNSAYATLKGEWQAQVRARHHSRRRILWLTSVASVMLVVGTLMLPVMDTDQWEVVIESGGLSLNGRNLAAPRNMTIDNESWMTTDTDARLMLDSGADLRLAAGSRVRWIAEDRVFLDHGSAYVDTSGAANFSIDTTLGRVRDIGTRYMVSVDRQILEVGVREGLTEIDSVHGIYLAEAQAGLAAVVSIDRSGISQSMEPAAAPRWSWIHNVAVGYSGHMVPEVLNQIGRDLGKRVEFASRGVSATIANEIIQGDLTSLDPRQALELVARSAGLSFVEQDDTIVVDLRH